MFDAVFRAKNVIRVEMTIANQCTGDASDESRSRLFLAFIYIYFLPQKIVHLLQIYIIFEMVSILKV